MLSDILNKSVKSYIYRVGRRQKDFEYVLPEVDIIGYVDDLPRKDFWMDKPVDNLNNYALSHNSDDMLIVCEPKNEPTLDKLATINLIYGVDWLWGEDCFKLLDFDTWAGEHIDRPIWIWGAGNTADTIWESVASFYNILGFIDNNPKKNEFHNLPVISPKDTDKWRSASIIVASYRYEEIKKQLLELGLQEVNDFVFFKQALPVSSYMLKAWQDEAFYNLQCYSMLNNLDYSAGDCYPCCTTFMLSDIGNTLFKPFEQIWNGKLHRVICMTTLNKTYTFCHKNICPALVNKKSETYNETYSEDKYPEIMEHPRVSNLCFDYSCNLYCESCRKNILVADKSDKDKINKFKDTALEKIVPYVDFLTMAGNGEVFMSPFYKEIWSSEVSKNCHYFQILSNGNLLTEDKWKLLTENRKSELLCCISIDAATESTYVKLRRGGNFKQLQENMEFLSNKRKTGELSYLRMNFVVQRANYKEMPDFIAWAKRLGADRVLFTKILNWGTYTDDEFQNISMVDKNGLPKKELKEILKNPLCNDEIVDIGTFSGEHKYQDTNFVGSYYLWEIDNYSDMRISEKLPTSVRSIVFP